MIIKINTENDAFYEDKFAEVGKILKQLGYDLGNCLKPKILRDTNGNICGTVDYNETKLTPLV